MECYNCGYDLPTEAERCPRCGQRFKPREHSEPAAAATAQPDSLIKRIKRLLGRKG